MNSEMVFIEARWEVEGAAGGDSHKAASVRRGDISCILIDLRLAI